ARRRAGGRRRRRAGGRGRSPAVVRHDAVVLAGGTGRRLGGALKPQVTVRGRRLLDHVLDATAGARRVVVVAPQTVPVPDGVVRTLENPPHGGPVAGIAAGLHALGVEAAPLVLVLACDLPGAARAVPRLLAAAAHLADSHAAGHADRGGGRTDVGDSSVVGGNWAVGGKSAVGGEWAVGGKWAGGGEPAGEGTAGGVDGGAWPVVGRGAVGGGGAGGGRGGGGGEPAGEGTAGGGDGVVLRDEDGRDQWLLGVYATRALRTRLAELAAAGEVRGTAVRALVGPLRLLPVPARPGEAHDVDTWADRDTL